MNSPCRVWSPALKRLGYHAPAYPPRVGHVDYRERMRWAHLRYPLRHFFKVAAPYRAFASDYFTALHTCEGHKRELLLPHAVDQKEARSQESPSQEALLLRRMARVGHKPLLLSSLHVGGVANPRLHVF